MRKTITTFALASSIALTSGFAAFAGGIAPVVVEPTVFVEEDEGSSGSMGSLGGAGGLLLAAVLIGAAVALADSDDDTDDDS